MKKDLFKTDVMFRKEKDNTILAVFPYDIADPKGNVTGYARLGQHTAVCWDYVLLNTKPAKEFTALQKELESLGYNINIVKRRNYSKYLNAYYEVRK
jgi:hypothetical protein